MMWLVLFIVGLVLILLVRKVLFPTNQSRVTRLMNTYRHLTPALLAETEDAELIDAVVANLLAKAENSRKDAYALIPTLGQERCAVYSLWLLQKELEAGDPAVLRESGRFGFTELASDALDFLSMPEAAQALRRYLQTADAADMAIVQQTLADQAVNAQLIALIRSEPAAFCDETAENPKIGD